MSNDVPSDHVSSAHQQILRISTPSDSLYLPPFLTSSFRGLNIMMSDPPQPSSSSTLRHFFGPSSSFVEVRNKDQSLGNNFPQQQQGQQNPSITQQTPFSHLSREVLLGFDIYLILISVFFFTAPVPLFYQAIRYGKKLEIPPEPFILQVCHCSTNLLFFLMQGDLAGLTVNVAGLTIGLVHTILYPFLSERKAFLKAFAWEILFLSMWICTVVTMGTRGMREPVGWLGVMSGVPMLCASLFAVPLAISEKNVSVLGSAIMNIAVSCVSFSWLFKGWFLINVMQVWIPNSIGFTCSLITLSVRCYINWINPDGPSMPKEVVSDGSPQKGTPVLSPTSFSRSTTSPNSHRPNSDSHRASVKFMEEKKPILMSKNDPPSTYASTLGGGKERTRS